ncbi:iron-sulfur cluster-binding protein [Desulfovibrio ferrophilus]|uniref:Iron-sulfur cluster-binding protein n=2 Tax=Desulfovibrio ferrophilus TaxID=241368 RepID=A0A2Z6AV24_9BACT|nr:iron-sulfur cluster-binding protein [Desulfovibrio ferrophilus]
MPAPPSTVFALDERLEHMRQNCIECGVCVRECAFLRRYGTPWRIAGEWNSPRTERERLPFSCSLCGLCTTVCPLDLDPKALFLDMRRSAVREGLGHFPEHNRLVDYETRGTSSRYTWYGLPDGCDTVFFPGCTFPGTRPAVTRKLFTFLMSKVPNLGVVMDCCTKPSHDLGREQAFDERFSEMRDWLVKRGIRRVLVNCPNCYGVFEKNGGQIRPETVYEYLAANGVPENANLSGAVSVHDPCPLRDHPEAHKSVRTLLDRMGLEVKEMKHHGMNTVCCGEGGNVAPVDRQLATQWGNIRREESRGRTVVTYCAGCTAYLSSYVPAVHVLDLAFFPKQAAAGQAKISAAPLTYLNRLRLKAWFKRTIKAAHERVRPEKPSQS